MAPNPVEKLKFSSRYVLKFKIGILNMINITIVITLLFVNSFNSFPILVSCNSSSSDLLTLYLPSGVAIDALLLLCILVYDLIT